MDAQKISVGTSQGVITYSCVLKNEESLIYQIVDSEGNNNPQSFQEKSGGEVSVFFFNGLKVVGGEVFTFTPFSNESFKLGELV